MKNIITILTALLLSQSISLAKDCFPGQAVSYSPAKHYSIIWQEPSDGETHHLIFSNGTERKLFFDFGREVCIHWESQEKYFALTYYEGSNVSEVYIYSPDEPRKLFDLVDLIPTRVKKLYAENHHSYIEVLDWADTGLLVRVWGYGDRSPKGFEVRLRCTTKDKFSCTEEKANKALKRGAVDQESCRRPPRVSRTSLGLSCTSENENLVSIHTGKLLEPTGLYQLIFHRDLGGL